MTQCQALWGFWAAMVRFFALLITKNILSLHLKPKRQLYQRRSLSWIKYRRVIHGHCFVIASIFCQIWRSFYHTSHPFISRLGLIERVRNYSRGCDNHRGSYGILFAITPELSQWVSGNIWHICQPTVDNGVSVSHGSNMCGKQWKKDILHKMESCNFDNFRCSIVSILAVLMSLGSLRRYTNGVWNKNNNFCRSWYVN